MTSRSHTTDRELLLILITLLLLAFATQFSNASDAGAEVSLAAPAIITQSAAVTLDATANPYWAPVHAFPRRLAPVYSDATGEATPHATQE